MRVLHFERKQLKQQVLYESTQQVLREVNDKKKEVIGVDLLQTLHCGDLETTKHCF